MGNTECKVDGTEVTTKTGAQFLTESIWGQWGLWWEKKHALISSFKNDSDNRKEYGFGMNSDTFEKQMVFQTTTMNKQNPQILLKILYTKMN